MFRFGPAITVALAFAAGAAIRLAVALSIPPAPRPAASARPWVPLEARLGSAVHLRLAPFAEAIGVIRDRTRATITVDWPALKAAGVEPTAPVTFDLPASRRVMRAL